jgi:NitT/TauT family transport system substrate-binding protein
LLFALAMCVSLPSVVLAQTRVTVGMASGVNQVPSLVAAQEGFFKEEGLNVEIKPVVRGNLAVEALIAGSMQFAKVSDVILCSAIDKGIQLIAIGVGSRGFTGKMVGAANLGEVKSLADLKGKRIGMQVGTGVHGVFQNLVKQEGLSESDFQSARVGPMMQRIVQARKRQGDYNRQAVPGP